MIGQSPLGKHLPYRQIQKRFDWLFDVYKEEYFFKFAVIRDPVDYLISLYRSHTDNKFKDRSELFTGNMTFDDFLEDWIIRNKDQAIPQSRRFLD